MPPPLICPKLKSPLKTKDTRIWIWRIWKQLTPSTESTSTHLQILDVLKGCELWQPCCLHHRKEVDKQRPVPAQDLIGSLAVLPEPGSAGSPLAWAQADVVKHSHCKGSHTSQTSRCCWSVLAGSRGQSRMWGWKARVPCWFQACAWSCPGNGQSQCGRA